MTRPHRSVSQIKSVSQCGERYYLERVADPTPQERPAAWTALGVAFHGAYETWELEGRGAGTLSPLFQLAYDEYIDDARQLQPNLDLWMNPPRSKTMDAIKNYRARGVKQADLWEARIAAEGWTVLDIDGRLGIEVEFEVDVDGVPLKGGVDLLLKWPDGRVTLRDLKTGSAKKDDRQLWIYSLVMREKYGIPVEWAEYWYLQRDVSGGWVNSAGKTWDDLVRVVHRADQIISQGLFLPNPGDQCGLCSVAPWCSEKGSLSLGEEL